MCIRDRYNKTQMLHNRKSKEVVTCKTLWYKLFGQIMDIDVKTFEIKTGEKHREYTFGYKSK